MRAGEVLHLITDTTSVELVALWRHFLVAPCRVHPIRILRSAPGKDSKFLSPLHPEAFTPKFNTTSSSYRRLYQARNRQAARA